MESKELVCIYGIIYCATNLINGKKYIGQTKNKLEIRIKKHLKNAKEKVNRHLYDSINHYGEENFEWKVIDFAVTKNDLNQKEIFYIKYFNSHTTKNGYNMTDGGDGGDTYSFRSDESKKDTGNKIRKALTGKKKPEGFAEHLSKVKTGTKMPEYSNEKVSKTKLLKSLNGFSVKLNVTEAQMANKVAKRKRTMLLKNEQQIKEKNLKYLRSRKSRVICNETGVIYENRRSASIAVYGDRKFAKWITQSNERHKKYLGFSWKYLDYLF